MQSVAYYSRITVVLQLHYVNIYLAPTVNIPGIIVWKIISTYIMPAAFYYIDNWNNSLDDN